MVVSNRELAVALRLCDGTEPLPTPLADQLARLKATALAIVDLECPDAPESVKDECCVRVAAYLFDQPLAARETRYANAWLNSGAGALASRWVERRVAGTESRDLPIGPSAPQRVRFEGRANTLVETGLRVPGAGTFAVIQIVQQNFGYPALWIEIQRLRAGGETAGSPAEPGTIAATDDGRILVAAEHSETVNVSMWVV